jgi:hypothetical protein
MAQSVAHGENGTSVRLVAAAVEETVFAAAVASTAIHRSVPGQDHLVPWVETRTPIVSMAAAGGRLIVVSKDGHVSELRPSDASEVLGVNVASDAAEAVSDSGGVWVLSANRRSIVHLNLDGHVDGRLSVKEVDRFAATDHGVWYTAHNDSFLRFVALNSNGVSQIDLAVSADRRGDIAPCRYAVWVSVEDGLLLVPERGRQDVRRMTEPLGAPVRNLLCVRTGLIGGDSYDGLFMLNFGLDDSVRPLPTGRSGQVDVLVTDEQGTWAVGRPEGIPIAVRLGQGSEARGEAE